MTLVAAARLQMIFNVKMYSIADRYNVMAPKSQAKEKFGEAVKTSSTPATD